MFEHVTNAIMQRKAASAADDPAQGWQLTEKQCYNAYARLVDKPRKLAALEGGSGGGGGGGALVAAR